MKNKKPNPMVAHVVCVILAGLFVGFFYWVCTDDPEFRRITLQPLLGELLLRSIAHSSKYQQVILPRKWTQRDIRGEITSIFSAGV